MNWFTGLMVYVMVWWLVLFTVLPWGNRLPDETEAGHDAGAPEKPRIWIKVAVTTLIASFIWGAIYLIIKSQIISFR